MHLLLGLCLLFVFSKCRDQHHGLYSPQLPPLLVSFFLPSFNFSFTFPFFLFLLSRWFYLPPHNAALWSRWQIPSAFQSGAKNNHLFFYSHWLCYNAATLSRQTRGQSIISPLAIQAAVCLLSAKHKDKARLPLSRIYLHSVLVSPRPSFKGKKNLPSIKSLF